MEYKVNQTIEIQTTEIEDIPSFRTSGDKDQLLANVYYANPIQVIEAPQLERDEDGLTLHYDWPYDLVAHKPFMVRNRYP